MSSKTGAKTVDPIAYAMAATKAGSLDAEPSVQLETPVDGISMVPAHLADAAMDAWKRGWDVYHKKGGIADKEKELKELRSGDTSVGSLLLKVGKACLVHAGNDTKKALALFKGACAIAETHARQESKDEEGKAATIQALLPTWTPAKGRIVKGLERGLALLDQDSKGNERYPTLSSVDQQVRNLDKADRERKQGEKDGTGGTLGAVTAMFKSDRLKVAFEHLTKQLVTLTEADQDKFAETLMATAQMITEAKTTETPQEVKEVAQAQRAAATATREKQSRRRRTTKAGEAAQAA